jgi:hypothetical protein
MKYFKSFNDFIFEKKDNGLVWNNFFIEYFSRIGLEQENTADAKIEKLQKFLSKDIFNSVISKSIILSDDDKKTYSQSNTQKKFEILMKQEYIGQMQDRYAEELGNIRDYLSDINTTIRDLDVNDLSELNDKANEYHDNLSVVYKNVRADETPETDKFIEYPNGWYWINLNVDYSQDEADNMGHCGRDAGKILFSLRDDKLQSHITASYSVSENALYQIKGRKNSKPKSEYHEMIIDMILNSKYPVNMMKTGSYKPQNDFSLTDLPEAEMRGIYEKKPSLEMTDKMFEKYHKENDLLSMLSMCVNGYIYDGYVSTRYNDENGINKMFNFIDEQKIDISLPENKEIVKRFITSTISLVTSDLVRYDDEYLEVISSFGVGIRNLGKYEIYPYPGVDKLIKYFGIEINDATIADYILERDVDAFEYAISTKDFGLSKNVVSSLLGNTYIDVDFAEYVISKLYTHDFKLSFKQIVSVFESDGMKQLNRGTREKMVFLLKNTNTYTGSELIKDIQEASNELSHITDMVDEMLELWFSYVGFDDDMISDLILEFSDMKEWFVDKTTKALIVQFGVERILRLMFFVQINPKYLFFMIKHTGRYMNEDEFYVLFNKYYNSCEDIKYCLDILEEYLEYHWNDSKDIQIDISSKKQELARYIDEDVYPVSYDYYRKFEKGSLNFNHKPE